MTDILKRLGYGGSAVVDGIQVLVTGGSFSSATNQTYVSMIDTPPVDTPANRVMHADGTEAYTGSVSFDVTVAAMEMMTVSRMLKRWYPFSVGINDGNDSYNMTGCKVSSLTLAGAAGGLVTASLSFMGTTVFAAGAVTNDFIRDDDTDEGSLVAYWWSGANSPLKAKSWTFTMTQEVVPAYGNKNEKTPHYLRAGLVEYSLDVESYTPIAAGTNDKLYLATTSFTLVGTMNEASFQYNGVTELGTYRYVFGTGANTGSSAVTVIT